MDNAWDDVIDTQEYNKNLARVQKIAQDHGYVLNPDDERLKKVVGLMTMNFNGHGRYYCPCKQSHPLDPNKDVICPCDVWEDEIVKDGKCFCKLFFKK
ncbi:ferredoxin:thioredoxin reductase [candidate division WOR-3 bacterium]|nr:ferredoxin:thioredoxin reductase [candidate division WOR-3 bacterium]